MKELKRVSRWITIKSDYVTPKHSLYCYADKDGGEGEKALLYYFRWNGRMYAFNQFLARFGIVGFDHKCERYPAFITGYDGEEYFNPLYCEIDEYGEKIRLYREI